MTHYKNLSLKNLTTIIEGEEVVERWKPVLGYEGLYKVSTFGRVKTLGNGVHKFKERILGQSIGDVGYLVVGLCKNGKSKKFRVHRLVATAFIKNPLNKRQVNHVKGVKTDNRVSKLEWATPKEDSQHAYKTGLLKLPPTSWNKGADNSNSRPINQYDLNGKFLKSFVSCTEAKRITGADGIGYACYGKRKTAGGFQWRWVGDKPPTSTPVSRFNVGSNHHNSKPVNQYTKDSVFLKKWDNARRASIETKILVQSIGKACKGLIPSAGGFKWKFA